MVNKKYLTIFLFKFILCNFSKINLMQVNDIAPSKNNFYNIDYFKTLHKNKCTEEKNKYLGFNKYFYKLKATFINQYNIFKYSYVIFAILITSILISKNNYLQKKLCNLSQSINNFLLLSNKKILNLVELASNIIIIILNASNKNSSTILPFIKLETPLDIAIFSKNLTYFLALLSIGAIGFLFTLIKNPNKIEPTIEDKIKNDIYLKSKYENIKTIKIFENLDNLKIYNLETIITNEGINKDLLEKIFNINTNYLSLHLKDNFMLKKDKERINDFIFFKKIFYQYYLDFSFIRNLENQLFPNKIIKIFFTIEIFKELIDDNNKQ